MSQQITISLDNINLIDFFGVNDSNFQIIKEAFPKLQISSRGKRIKISGNHQDVTQAKEKIESMVYVTEKYGKLSEKQLGEILRNEELFDIKMPEFSEDVLVYGPNGAAVKAKSPNQRKMVSMMEINDILFAIGPAGTGKTYTAVALAVRALKNKQVKKIVLARPAVEAGESLGFLPGDIKEKIDPYLRPLYDALDDMIPMDKLNYYVQSRTVEIAPLAYMRGRTLDNAFIILDEAQNATDSQLKMFLTRIGPSAKCIITGDLTQVDLPGHQKSGLPKAVRILENIDGIGTVYLTDIDVIRHRLVKHIINAYKGDKKEMDK